MNARDQRPSGGGGSGSGKAATQAAGQSVNGAEKVKSDPGRTGKKKNRNRKPKPKVQSESTCPPRLLRLLLPPRPRPIPEGCLAFRGRRADPAAAGPSRDRLDSSKGARRRWEGRGNRQRVHSVDGGTCFVVVGRPARVVAAASHFATFSGVVRRRLSASRRSTVNPLFRCARAAPAACWVDEPRGPPRRPPCLLMYLFFHALPTYEASTSLFLFASRAFAF